MRGGADSATVRIPLTDQSGIDPRWLQCGFATAADGEVFGCDTRYRHGVVTLRFDGLDRGATTIAAVLVGDYAQSRDVLGVSRSPQHVTTLAYAIHADRAGHLTVSKASDSALTRHVRSLVGG